MTPVRNSATTGDPSQWHIGDVTPAFLNGVALATNRIYGATNPIFNVTYFGFRNGDGAQVLEGNLATSTSADTNSAVGSYPITASGQSAANYTIGYLAGTLIVEPALLQVIIDDQSRLYGEPNPLLSGTIVGIQNGDPIKAEYTTLAILTSPVGAYHIVGKLDDPEHKLDNYVVSTNSGMLSVTPAP